MRTSDIDTEGPGGRHRHIRAEHCCAETQDGWQWRRTNQRCENAQNREREASHGRNLARPEAEATAIQSVNQRAATPIAQGTAYQWRGGIKARYQRIEMVGAFQ